MRENGQVRGVIWPERRWSGGGVRCQSTGSGQLGRWPDGVPDAKRNRRPRGEASLHGRQREVEGEAGKRARHGSDSKRRARVLVKWIGAHRRILFERLRLMGRSDWLKEYGIWTVDLRSGGLHVLVQLGGWAEPRGAVRLEPYEQCRLGLGLGF